MALPAYHKNLAHIASFVKDNLLLFNIVENIRVKMNFR